MNSFARVPAKLALLVGLAACAAPPPEAKILHKAHQSTVHGNWDESIGTFSQAIQSTTDERVLVLSYSSRCEVYLWKGQNAVALEDCNRSIRTRPDLYGNPYAVRGRIFANMGQFIWALEDFDIAIDLGGPGSDFGGNNPKVIAYGGKARVFATSPDPSLRDKDLGVQFAEKAVKFESRLETPAYRILHRDTLAAAYAEAGRFDDAIEEQNKTISMVKANGWDTVTYDHEPLLEILKRHLKQFENREPLRGGPY